MKIKRYAAVAMLLIILLTNYTTAFAQNQPKIYSDGVYLANVTGQVLVSENENKKYQPGGIVKMMTCMVALEKCNLTDEVTITEESIITADTNMALKPGEVITIENLCYGAIVANASDAAHALALHVAGNEKDFVDMMNQKAKELGCENTHFTNCTGAASDDQYTTPYDLYKMTVAAINNANLNTIIRTSNKSIKKTNKSENRFYYSNNYLICAYYDNRYFYSDAQGGKTGYTDEGGYAITSFATVGTTQLVAVVMGGEKDADGFTSFRDSVNMFKHGFTDYKSVNVTGDILYESKIKYAAPSEEIILCAQHSLKALVAADDTDYKFDASFNVPENLEPPVDKGEVVGSVTYSYNGHEVGTVPLVASEKYSRTLMFFIAKFFGFLWQFTIVKVIVFILLGVLIYALYIILSIMTGSLKIKRKPGYKKGKQRIKRK